MNDTCKQCGAQCCKFVSVSASDHQSAAVLSGRAAFTVNEAHYIPARCKYLDATNQCSIYPIRPELCRTFAVDCQACRDVRSGATRKP